MEKNVLAKVGNQEITREQMLQLMRSLPQQQAMEVSTVDGRKRLLDEMIAGELLYLEAIEKDYDKDSEFFRILEEATHSLLQRYAVQKLLQDVSATDEEVKDYYDEHENEFVSEEEVEARHILVATEEEATNVQKEIEEGLDFSDAAKQYSTCPSKERGGELGAFSKGKMVPEFEEVAFDLSLDTVSDPVKTQFGYHLIIVDKKSEASQKSFDEVKGQIKQQLLRGKQQKIYVDKVNELKDKYSVEVNESAIQ